MLVCFVVFISFPAQPVSQFSGVMSHELHILDALLILMAALWSKTQTVFLNAQQQSKKQQNMSMSENMGTENNKTQ